MIEGGDWAALVAKLSRMHDRELYSDRRYPTKGGAVLWARERATLLRDSTGRSRYLLARTASISAAGTDPLQRLSGREREVLAHVVAGRTSSRRASTPTAAASC